MLAELKRLGDWLKAEWAPRNYCREVVTIDAGEVLKDGTVVAKQADGAYIGYDNNQADDAGGVAGGVLIGDVDATAGDTPGVILARGPAIVSKQGLTFIAANDAAGDLTDAYANLLALGIVCRDSSDIALTGPIQ